MRDILEKLNNIEKRILSEEIKNSKSNEKNKFQFLKKISKTKNFSEFVNEEFGRNIKYSEQELKKAEEEYYDYVIWNGLKYRDKAIDEISKRYGFNKIVFTNHLKKRGLYDMKIPYRELKENRTKTKQNVKK